MTSADTPSGIDQRDLQYREDGPLYHVAKFLGVWRGQGAAVRVGVAIALLTWVPLIILTAIEGTLLSGPTIAARDSLGTHARLLLAIPLFFVAESLFTGRISDVLGKMLRSQLVAPADLPDFASACRQAHRWWHSWLAEVALVVVAVASIQLGLRADLSAGVSTWRTTVDGRLSLAGWWYVLVSLPFFQFLFWRWCWRLFVWGRLLWRISRLELQLMPTHPDRAGGLGPLGVAHVDLSPLSFAWSAILATNFAERIMFAGADVRQLVVPAAASVVATTAALIAPLLLFSRQLLEVKQQGLLDYGAFAEGYVRAFHAKWLRGAAPPDEPFLGTADLQSLADLGNSFGVIVDMRIVPIASSQIIMVAASSILPMLPLVLFAFPFDQLLIGGLKSLIGL